MEGVALWESNCLANHWNYYPEPASNSVKQAGGWRLHPIELGTSNSLPSHPKQKMVEPQTAVLPLLGLISVAYRWRLGMTGCLCIHHQCKHLWFKTKADCTPHALTKSPSPSLLNTFYSEAGWFGVIIPMIARQFNL